MEKQTLIQLNDEEEIKIIYFLISPTLQRYFFVREYHF